MREINKKQFKKGFTLVEILVAVFIFSIVIGSIVTIFVITIRQQNIILRNQIVLNQISYVIEFMSRSLRMAKKDLNGSCLNIPGCNYLVDDNNRNRIKFINTLDGDDCQEFYLESEQLKYKKSSWAEGMPLTATSSLKVKNLEFRLSGGCDDDTLQPRLTIKLEAENPIRGGEKINIQTTISQRNLDVPE